MKLRNAAITGFISLSAIGGLVGPAHAAARPATASAVKADKCSVHVNIAHPVALQTEALTVTSTAAETTVQVTIKYKTVTHVWKFKTPKSTKTTDKFGVGHPTPGYRVTISGKVIAPPRATLPGPRAQRVSFRYNPIPLRASPPRSARSARKITKAPRIIS